MELYQQLLTAVLMISIGVGLAIAQKRGLLRLGLRSRTGPSGNLELIGRLVLSQQHTVQLVRVREGLFVIVTYPGGVELREYRAGGTLAARATRGAGA